MQIVGRRFESGRVHHFEERMTKNDGGPAFLQGSHSSMSLRDYFAAKAMHGYMLRNAILKDRPLACSDIAMWSYDMADAMIAEREK